MTSPLSPEVLASRYALLCRASHLDPDDSPVSHALASQLTQLEHIIKTDLPALSQRNCPDDFSTITYTLHQELLRFREFCEFPALAGKIVVGVGGRVSAGKSSLLNSLIDKRRLAAAVDPTTSLPAYIMHGESEQITALNLFRRRVQLSSEEFLSLNHEEKHLYGSQVGALLNSAFITDPAFPWENLALLDTPGYSKPEEQEWSERTDANLARTQLNSAQFILWVVSAEAGTLPEDDIRFLSTLRPDIPRIVLISRADKRPADDMARIVQLIRKTLEERALPVLDVIPFSNRKKQDYPLAPLHAHLDTWNRAPRQLGFARNFKSAFTQYRRYLDEELRTANKRLNRVNRILSLAEDDMLQNDAQELKSLVNSELNQLQQISETLSTLQERFFRTLKAVGDQIGIPLPAPQDIELLELPAFDLLSLLQVLREARGEPEPEYNAYWEPLQQKGPAPRRAALTLRDDDHARNDAFAALCDTTVPAQRDALLLRALRDQIAPLMP